MSHPLCWPQSLSSYSRSRFHPLGQSPAISLTQDLSPEQSATILSLECGDIYNVLFTLQADLYVGPGLRKMDITRSTSETAILARNILAFTLIYDEAPIDQIWNIYYHFKLDSSTAELLTRQSQTLVDASASHGSWTQSRYQSFINIIDTNTLAELHRYWTFYARFPTLSSAQVDKLQTEQKEWSDALLHKLGPNVNAAVARSATLVWADAAIPISNQFRRYLRTGTTSAQVNDLVLNPTWAYSSLGEKFDPAASSFPMSFHLVSAFLLPSKCEPTLYLEAPLDKAKEQFKAGCEAFKKSLDANAITLRFYAGDALPFCRALTHCGTGPNQIFTSSWHAHTVDLSSYFLTSPPPPHRFDVIQTSRLGDTGNLGLINILLATCPLRSTPTSPIYTEVHSITEEAAVQLFIERISADVPRFSIFMGLVARAYASGFDSQGVTTDITFFNTTEYSQRAVWTDITTGDSQPQSSVGVSFSVENLADALFSVYRQMHFYDNTPDFYAPATFPQMRTWSELNMTRETVALFFRHIQDRGRVWVKDGTWEDVATRFLELVKGDWVVFDGARHLEDMRLQLGLVGILLLQADELVCVVLSIPAATKELDTLRGFDEMVPPRLSCALRPSPDAKSQIFSSIHGTWGKLVPSPSSDQFTIEESPEGTSNLIISFWAPAKLVQPGTQVELVFRYTCLVLHIYREKLGPDYVIFKATVGSDERVKVLKERPAKEGTQRAPLLASVPVPEKVGDLGFEVQGHWKEDRRYTNSITGRLDISSEGEKQVLRDGAKVEMTQLGPCTLRISVGDYPHTITSGYPIREKNVKVRIARKSAYIEMVADPYNPLDGGYPHTHFPSPAWNIHHIALDSMPSINVYGFPNADWLILHTLLQHSDHERAIMRSSPGATPRDKLHALKIDITTVAHPFFGIKQMGGPYDVFALSVPGEGVQAIVLVGGMRIDLANGTFLLDAGVIPVCPTTKGQVLPLLDPIGKAGVLIMSVDIKQGEMGVFKEYLAACVERCRTWSHRQDCSKADSFLCTCGQGIGFTAPGWNLAWWTQLFPHATRAAISPVFSVAYLELVAGDEFKVKGYGHPPPQLTPLNGCWACAKSGVELSVCGKCKRARYCSPDCQKGHWKHHKKLCGK